MVRNRATAAEWERYYQRADRVRSIAGDPFRRHAHRMASRERALMVLSALFLLTSIAAFFLLAVQ
jgi:hypothetical protein